MRILVTGASGWIGSATVPELIGAGHEVVGLARSEASAAAIEAAGATAVRGGLEDLDVLREAATSSDGLAHLAFNHDWMQTGDFEGAAQLDRAAVELFGEVLAGSDRPLVIASGLFGVAPGRAATEVDGHEPTEGFGATRHGTAELTLSFADRGIRSSVVRLPPTVHGDGDKGFVPTIIGVARDKGVSGYIGDGANRWPAVHRFDAARLFRLAIESAPAGSTLHGVGDEGVPIRELAEAIGRGLDLPVTSVAQDDAAAHFGWIAPLLGTDTPATCAITRELLGWEPTHPGLIEDLDQGHYFTS